MTRCLLDFGRALGCLGRAGWDSENTLQIQGTGPTVTLGPDLTVRGKNGAISGSNQRGSVTRYVLQRAVLAELLGREDKSYLDLSRRLGIPVGSIGPTRQRAVSRLRLDPRLDPRLDALSA